MDRNQKRLSPARAFIDHAGKIVIVGLALMVMSSCGDDEGPTVSKREFGQGVDLIHYQLQSAQINIKVEHGSSPANRGSEEMSRKLNLTAGSQKDHIQRVIDGPHFKLVVNDEMAEVEVSSQENIDHHQNVAENSPACRLSGRSDVAGKATSLEIDFRWNLNVTVDGESCGDMSAKMQTFIESELKRFHIKSVNDLLVASDLSTENRRQVQIQVQIRGVSE